MSRLGVITVVALGDLGRSPRMLNHALMLAESGMEVTLAGYEGSPIDLEITNHPGISIRYLRHARRAPEGASRARFLATAAWRGAWLFWELSTLVLFRSPGMDAILVQNPPSLPTLFSAWLAARLRGARFYIDWHNFGYTMLALRLGPSHPAVRMSAAYEWMFQRLADGHLCVSKAMALRLGGSPLVLYDRPRVVASILSRNERLSLASDLLQMPLTADCAILVSPTSWSADEPMEPLIDALNAWERMGGQCRLVVVISGLGPLRDRFEKQIQDMKWTRSEIRTVFLEPAEYREMLRSADLGLCFHHSSSGVDLPMKVMDLFGGGAPVCAFHYGPCIAEQIVPNETGLLFKDGIELASQLRRLFDGDPELRELGRLRRNVAESRTETWAGEWDRVALPLFTAARNTRTL